DRMTSELVALSADSLTSPSNSELTPAPPAPGGAPAGGGGGAPPGRVDDPDRRPPPALAVTCAPVTEPSVAASSSALAFESMYTCTRPSPIASASSLV